MLFVNIRVYVLLYTYVNMTIYVCIYAKTTKHRCDKLPGWRHPHLWHAIQHDSCLNNFRKKIYIENTMLLISWIALSTDKYNTMIVSARAGACVTIWHKIPTSVSLPKVRSQVKCSFQLGYLWNFLLGISGFLVISSNVFFFVEAVSRCVFLALIIDTEI